MHRVKKAKTQNVEPVFHPGAMQQQAPVYHDSSDEEEVRARTARPSPPPEPPPRRPPPRSTAPARRNADSASDFECSDDEDDESDGSEFSDVSVGDFMRRAQGAEDHMQRVARALPAERAAIQRAIQKHRAAGKLQRLEKFVELLSGIAIRATHSLRKEDISSLDRIIESAQRMKERCAGEGFCTP